jgi:hypothetical protein
MPAVRQPASLPVQKRPSDRRIGPWGTIARVLVGGGLIGAAIWTGLRWYDLALGLAVLPGATTLALRFRGRHAPALRFEGPAGHCLACAVAVGILVLLPQTAMLWYGASMLVVAGRRTTGCEPFAVPNWILGRDDQLACPLFGPIDTAEARARTNRTTTHVDD